MGTCSLNGKRKQIYNLETLEQPPKEPDQKKSSKPLILVSIFSEDNGVNNNNIKASEGSSKGVKKSRQR